ncbi:MAG: DUF2384 domain-containing protein [Planctomycetes bacterium]|nr:DUF2384 domain-containing protein [Planctomycetota bacterium]
MPQPRSVPSTDPAAVVTKAVLRAAERLGLSQQELAGILGVSGASASRLRQARSIPPDSKEGELALLFVRVFRSLVAIVGNDEEAARRWFGARCEPLGGTPRELVGTVTGLCAVVDYLDAMRGRA